MFPNLTLYWEYDIIIDMTIKRLTTLSENNSFLMFGARGTGKTTLLKQLPYLKDSLYIDLLDADTE